MLYAHNEAHFPDYSDTEQSPHSLSIELLPTSPNRTPNHNKFSTRRHNADEVFVPIPSTSTNLFQILSDQRNTGTELLNPGRPPTPFPSTSQAFPLYFDTNTNSPLLDNESPPPDFYNISARNNQIRPQDILAETFYRASGFSDPCSENYERLIQFGLTDGLTTRNTSNFDQIRAEETASHRERAIQFGPSGGHTSRNTLNFGPSRTEE